MPRLHKSSEMYNERQRGGGGGLAGSSPQGTGQGPGDDGGGGGVGGVGDNGARLLAASAVGAGRLPVDLAGIDGGGGGIGGDDAGLGLGCFIGAEGTGGGAGGGSSGSISRVAGGGRGVDDVQSAGVMAMDFVGQWGSQAGQQVPMPQSQQQQAQAQAQLLQRLQGQMLQQRQGIRQQQQQVRLFFQSRILF